MTVVFVVCEGATEETFVTQVLAPHFRPAGLFLKPQGVNTSQGHKGGALKYERVKLHLRNTLRQSNNAVVTTMFDLYALDKGFPGFEAASRQADLATKLSTLNRALHTDIVATANCRPERFIPHIQPHEFEALLFSDVSGLTSIEQGWSKATAALSKVRQAAATPEHINNHPDTKPASHLMRELKGPGFDKSRHGPIAAQRIGLAAIEAECPFFAEWMAALRRLSA